MRPIAFCSGLALGDRRFAPPQGEGERFAVHANAPAREGVKAFRPMSPDLLFILLLVLRMVVAAAFVVSASIITERSGPVIGALIATLPISAGPSYVVPRARP